MTSSIFDRAESLLSKIEKHKSLLAHVRNVGLEIDWPRWSWYAAAGRKRRFEGMVALLENMETICLALTYLPDLRTLTIIWHASPMFENPAGDDPRMGPVITACPHTQLLNPPKSQITVLLRSLKIIRRARPEIMIKMPTDGPISSAELAQLQQDSRSPELNRARETEEDLIEMRENLALASQQT